MKKYSIIIKSFFAAAISIFMCYLCITLTPACFHFLLSAKNTIIKGGNISSDIHSFSTSAINEMALNRVWLDYYGLLQKAIGKHEVNNFDIVKDNDGYLYACDEKTSQDIIYSTVNTNSVLYNYAKSKNIPYLFVQVPYKSFDKIPELNGYLPKITEPAEDAICSGLSKIGAPVLDLRDTLQGHTYYRTDHHWTADTAFQASKLIRDELNSRFNFTLDKENVLTDINSYTRTVYPNCFLGSAGIRTGIYYAGKDDFVVLYPKFHTDLSYKHYVQGQLTCIYNGDFETAFIDKQLINDKTYNNKYNANLHGGYVENVIANHASENNLKALLITHSYGRNMVQYFSLLFAETHYLDPQVGRFNDNLLEYIDKYKPDVIVCMYDNPINVG